MRYVRASVGNSLVRSADVLRPDAEGVCLGASLLATAAARRGFAVDCRSRVAVNRRHNGNAFADIIEFAIGRQAPNARAT